MEQQRGQKSQMIENDNPVVREHQGQQHCQQPVGTTALQIGLYQQDRMRQLQQLGQEQFMRSYRDEQQKYHSEPSRLNEVQNSHQNLGARSSLSQPIYEPGRGALLVADYLSELRNRAKDNNELFWRTFVVKFFAPGAKNRLCIPNSSVVPPKDNWRCNICRHIPTTGLEVEFLPSLFRIKYESGTLEELWSIGRPNEYQNSSGQIMLDYEKATLHTIYENIHVLHEGQLRVCLAQNLKISSWDFCVRQFEELVPKRLINTQLIQPKEADRRHQLDVLNASSNSSAKVLQDSRHRFLTPSLELTEVLKPPIDRTFGFSNRTVQSLQINEVLAGKTMERIMKYSKQTGSSATESSKVVQAVSDLLSVNHAPTLPRNARDPVAGDNYLPLVELPHQSGSALPPSFSKNSPRVDQQASGSRQLPPSGHCVDGSNADDELD